MTGMRYQPQGLQKLSSNSLTRGHAFLVNPASQTNVIDGRALTSYGNIAKTLDGSLGGIALICDGVNDAWASASGTAYKGTGTDATLWTVIRRATPSSSRNLLGTSNTNAGLQIGYSTAFSALSFAKGSVVGLNSGFNPAVGTPVFFAVSYVHSTGAILYFMRDLTTGIVSTSTATNTQAWATGDGNFNYGGYQTGPNNTWVGNMGPAGIAMRAMSVDELTVLSSNPWQLFAGGDEEDDVITAGGSNITAGISWTEADDTVSILSVLSNTTSLAWTEADDSHTSIVTLTNRTSLAYTESDDIFSVSGTVTDRATITWTESDDTFNTQVVEFDAATLGWTETNDSYGMTGSVYNNAQLGWLEDNDAMSSSGVATNRATFAWIESDDGALFLGGLSQSGQGKRRKSRHA